MKPSPDNLTEVLLFWDGQLTPVEAEAFLRKAQADPALGALLREEAVLQGGLAEAGAFESAPPRRLRLSAWVPRAAAAAVVCIAFFAGRFTAGPDPARDVRTVVFQDEIANATAASFQARMGDAVLRVHPGASGARTGDGFRLDGGTVEVEGPRDTSVRVEGLGTVRLRGHGVLSYDSGGRDSDDPVLVVQMLRGRARLLSDRHDPETVGTGELKVFERRGFRSVRQLIARLDALEGDESLTTLTLEEWESLLSSLGQDREALESRVGALLDRNQRLALELDAIRSAGGERKAPAIRDYLEVLARESGHRGAMPGRQPWSPHWWGEVRHLVKRFEGREADLVQEVESVLLAPEAPSFRRRIGLSVLRHVPHAKSVEVAARFLQDEEEAIRSAAIQVLVESGDVQSRRLLLDAFRSDPSVDVRVSAAGGLMKPEDAVEVLPWLLEQFDRSPRHPEHLRRRILARVSKAPPAEFAEFAVGIGIDPDESRVLQMDVLWMLSRLCKLGSGDAAKALDFLSVAAADLGIRVWAGKFLAEAVRN